MLLSANGVGAILGVLGLGLLGSTQLRPIAVTLGALIWSVLIILFAISSSFSLSLLILCFIGGTSIIFTSMTQSIIQASAPDHLRGRIIGVYNLAAHGMRVVSGFLIGSLASLVGAPMAVLAIGSMTGLVLLGAAITARALWNLDLKGEAPIGERRVAAAS
jgi:MFS family permease